MVAPDAGGAHVEGLLDAREPDLIEAVRIGDELVVIELEDERNLVRVLPRAHAEHAERGGHRVAPAFEAKLDDVLGIEIERVRRKRRARGMLDALVHRQDRHVAGAGQPPVIEQRLQFRHHLNRAIRLEVNPLDEIRTGQVQRLLGNRLALVLQQ